MTSLLRAVAVRETNLEYHVLASSLRVVAVRETNLEYHVLASSVVVMIEAVVLPVVREV